MKTSRNLPWTKWKKSVGAWIHSSSPSWKLLHARKTLLSRKFCGLCGFVGEFCVFIAAWNFAPELAIPAVLSVILTAGYLLWTWQRVFLGTNPATAAFPDLSAREFVVLAPFVILAIALGILPGVLVNLWVEPSVQGWVETLARLK